MLPSDVSCFPIQIPTIPSSFEIYSCFRYFSVEKPSPTASSSAVGRGDIGRTRGTFQRDVPARNLETPLLQCMQLWRSTANPFNGIGSSEPTGKCQQTRSGVPAREILDPILRKYTHISPFFSFKPFDPR
jgi:hypothetical protein